MQSNKIIDVKESYIPIDPNAFPENYHGTQREDRPVESPPVIPYMGENFLPTSYGYKSFFGTNYNVNIASLNPNQAEHIFIFQNLAYNNVLIALCDTGIWAKDAGTTGAWTQLVALTAPGNGVYYEWFFEIVKNKLYCFRGNGTAYYVITTDIGQALGINIATVVPSFITVTAQLGMFRLGGRLGFWDAENAIAWSSPDDLSSFTPDVLTGANVTTFNSITGKISAIRTHGKHAIVYASKNVTLLEVAPAETFLIKATPIIQAGVIYNRQSVVAYPSTIHFCYASSGIYKIENGKAEVIIPEVFDYFKDLTNQPIYLKHIQGRFLAFEMLDPDAINGNPIFTEAGYPEGTLTFPGSTSLAGYSQMPASSVDFCQVMSQLNLGMTDEQQGAATAQLPDKKPGTFAQPVYACWISNNSIKDVSNLAWDSSPCGATDLDGNPWHMSPNVPTLPDYTGDSTNKTYVTGDDAYLDGKWTMERFVATQSAIWQAEEAAIAAVLAAILARAFFQNRVTMDSNSCVASNPAPTYCALGDFVSDFSDYKFGFNACSFWLTRFITETKRIRSKTTGPVVTCTDAGTDDTPVPPDHYELWTGGSFHSSYATEAAAIAYCTNLVGSACYTYWSPDPPLPNPPGSGDTLYTNGVGQPRRIDNDAIVMDELKAVYVNANPTTRNLQMQSGTGWTGGSWPSVVSVYEAGYSTKTETKSAINEVESTQTGVLGVETGYCELIGWNYTKNDGTTAYSAATSCTDTQNAFPGAPTTTGVRGEADVNLVQPDIIDADGMICNIPFQAPLSPTGVQWAPETITYPNGDFLLQDGSIAPRWPTIYGAYIYDLHLKKWGKYKGTYKQLLDYFPVNSDSAPVVSTDNQGMIAGALLADGLIYLFDDAPTSSFLTWGKIGYYRKGVTDLQEVVFNFRQPATGSVKIDLSLDGKNIITPAAYEVSHTSEKQVTVYPPYTGKWYNVTIKGKFDITDLTVKGLTKGIK